MDGLHEGQDGAMRIRQTCLSLGVAVLALTSATGALAFSQVVAFGDSLSDTGNLYTSLGGAAPSAPYSNGRFTNGPVAVEVLAKQLSVPLVDLAYGGALTGSTNQFESMSTTVENTGMAAQIDQYLAPYAAKGKSVDASALYFVWGGGNDFLAALNAGDILGMPAVLQTAVSNLVSDVSKLYQAGARDLMVGLLPDLGYTFYATSGQVPGFFLSAMSKAFNLQLNEELSQLAQSSPGMNLHVFDTVEVTAGIRSDMQAHGANVTGRCWAGDYFGNGTPTPVCSDPSNYFLFDAAHPTAYVHELVGKAMAASVVPEPETTGLTLAGCAVVLALARRRVKPARASSV
jgi:phospholipase/lecithinase/hemolysin